MTTNLTYSAHTTLAIDAPPKDVWRALTDPELIRKYLHGTNTTTDWKVGSPITWEGEWQGKPYKDKGKILEFEPAKRLTTTHWSPLSGKEDKPENYHVVTYKLEPNDSGTTLTLEQKNSPSQEDADKMVKNWEPVLRTMKEVVEETVH